VLVQVTWQKWKAVSDGNEDAQQGGTSHRANPMLMRFTGEDALL